MREPRNYENPLCAEVGTDIYYPEDLVDGSQLAMRQAQRICGSCIHQAECAEWGIRHERYGIWGGLTVNQRDVIRRQRGLKVRDIA